MLSIISKNREHETDETIEANYLTTKSYRNAKPYLYKISNYRFLKYYSGRPIIRSYNVDILKSCNPELQLKESNLQLETS